MDLGLKATEDLFQKKFEDLEYFYNGKYKGTPEEFYKYYFYGGYYDDDGLVPSYIEHINRIISPWSRIGGITYLHYVCNSGPGSFGEDNTLEVVRELLKHDADPNIPGDSKFSCLTEAYLRKCYKVVLELLEHGAKVGEPCPDLIKHNDEYYFKKFQIYKILCKKIPKDVVDTYFPNIYNVVKIEQYFRDDNHKLWDQFHTHL